MQRYQARSSERMAFTMVVMIAIIVAMSQVLLVVSTYIPNIGNYNQLMRRSGQSTDADSDDEMDQEATAPYQQGGRGGDGYEENEPDGPYGESPREEEGQADLEKFFDDHLGASERDGMDKENLPSNIVPVLAPMNRYYLNHRRSRRSESKRKPLSTPRKASPVSSSSVEDFYSSSPKNSSSTSSFHDNDNKIETNQQLEARQDDGAGSVPVITTENEDLDRIYVTNLTDKPFKIDALGGYDPEEDFRDASKDLDEPTKFNAPLDDAGKEGGGKKKGEVVAQVKDIIFTDPETDTLYNDASETDEVTFARDDPDLEEADTTDSVDDGQVAKEDATSADDEPRKDKAIQKRQDNEDDSEGNWVNDGVEDMDIPSQSHQDRVLNKAAERQALAERNAAADDGPQQQEQQPESQDEESQRMPNADYMKDDMKAELGGDNDEALA